MCIFSGQVESVSSTQIFARGSGNGRQFLVYSMTLSSRKDVAMILPLPVPANSAEDAVHFINLQDYPEFFTDMQNGFPRPRSLAATDGCRGYEKPLAVVSVGSFDASFVPTVKDFSRLDSRFRLPDTVWDSLPLYRDHGFAVFKLKKGKAEVHPMAFDFPWANSDVLFFPTVHIHDGKVYPRAEFDHALYCQENEAEPLFLQQWVLSSRPAQEFMDATKSQQLLALDLPCYRLRLRGVLANEDKLVGRRAQ